MNSHSLSFILLLVVVACNFSLYGCQSIDTPDNEEIYDAGKIDQHLEADVTFTEKYRPQFHYTPRINWMNDPNGLVFYDGEFHLFHQYNPFGNQWGFMSWNHAVSTDLVHWEHKPVAIAYGKEEKEGIFSGSAVVDHSNTSGFGDIETPPIVAVYTSAFEGDRPNQAQSLAYSTDGGETFIKYKENPVLDHNDPDFRDPNVMWDDQREEWVMVVALPTQHKVAFYSSPNLIDWEFLSEFGPAGAVDGIWECPDLFQLPVDGDPGNMKWVLHVDMNPGAVAGGSGSQYFVGDWNGESFTEEKSTSNDEILWTDYGTDFYAAISWSNVPKEDGRRLWVGWMNNWDYANQIPTSPWRSAMSVPRSVELKSTGDQLRLVQQPVDELKSLRKDHVQLQNVSVVNGEVKSLSDQNISGKAYEIEVEIDPADADVVGLMLRAGEEEYTLVGYDAVKGTTYVDRTQSGESGFSDLFEGRYDAPTRLENGVVKLHLLVDWSSVEVFVGDGEAVLTNRIFPDPQSRDIRLFAE
ncbi:MAG: hypothetical protein GVY08_01080, partial [Bacteroidetes bacterium]|nr:hypothetical protein [Bacteroidota bacterium]